MKNLFKFRILAAFLVMATLAFTRCKKDDPAPIPQPGATQIVGTAKLPVGVAGDLANAKVSVYLTVDDWNFNNPVKFVGAQGSGATVTFTMPVIAGNYYLDVWREWMPAAPGRLATLSDGWRRRLGFCWHYPRFR